MEQGCKYKQKMQQGCKYKQDTAKATNISKRCSKAASISERYSKAASISKRYINAEIISKRCSKAAVISMRCTPIQCSQHPAFEKWQNGIGKAQLLLLAQSRAPQFLSSTDLPIPMQYPTLPVSPRPKDFIRP